MLKGLFQGISKEGGERKHGLSSYCSSRKSPELWTLKQEGYGWGNTPGFHSQCLGKFPAHGSCFSTSPPLKSGVSSQEKVRGLDPQHQALPVPVPSSASVVRGSLLLSAVGASNTRGKIFLPRIHSASKVIPSVDERPRPL